MKTCLRRPTRRRRSQQDKTKKCDADATGKTGDERKAFMQSLPLGLIPSAAGGGSPPPPARRLCGVAQSAP